MDKIIFVDDDPEIINSIRRMLFSMRKIWDMRFLTSGLDVLSMMENEKFDVIISDMLMPKMSGAELLEFVRDHYPETIRIALSGQADRSTSLNAVKSVHQFLAKPIDSTRLKSTIIFALTLNQLLNSEELKKLVSGLKSIPAHPLVYQEIILELQNPQPSVEKIGELISKDIALSAKILQLVNSAFFGLPRQVATPSEATVLLGFETIRDLTLYLNLFSQFSPLYLKKFNLQDINDHSIRTALIGRKIANELGVAKSEQDKIFVAGLMHDVGKLILVSNFPKNYLRVNQIALYQGNRTNKVEKEIFSSDHAQVGAYLLGLWNFPEAVLQAVVSHHETEVFILQSGTLSQILDCANTIEKFIHKDPSNQKLLELVKAKFSYYQFPLSIVDNLINYFLAEKNKDV